MAKITFYEKPGCGNNTRQKALLIDAGHEVIARNLLTEPWTAEQLLVFFNGLPVAEWFNRAASQIGRNHAGITGRNHRPRPDAGLGSIGGD